MVFIIIVRTMTLKTIKIDEALYKKLLERKRENESMSNVIARILNIHIEPQDIKIGTSSISEKGQITIPKDIRDKLGILQGDRLVFNLKGDTIIIRKSGSNTISEILKNQKPWKQSSLEFQKQLREEWE